MVARNTPPRKSRATPVTTYATTTAADIGLNAHKRNNARADGLNHLVPNTTSKVTPLLGTKRKIVGHLVCLHMLALQVLRYEWNHFPRSSTGPSPGSRFHTSLSEFERQIDRELLAEIYEGHHRQPRIHHEHADTSLFGFSASDYTTDRMQEVMGRAESLKHDQLNLIIMNTKPNACYDDFLLTQRKLYELAKDVSMHQRIRETDGECYAHWSGGSSVKLANPEPFNLDLDVNMEQLVVVLKILQSLRASIGEAAESSHLTRDELRALKVKLSAFDHESRYANATHLVSYALEVEPCLANTKSERWWDVSDYGLTKPPSTSTSSRKPATVTKTVERMRSTLTFIVPTVSLLSIIPAAIAWKHSDSTPGRTIDSSFWQALASSIMQLLGLITFIWPTLNNPRLSQLTWVWIWGLAGFSAVCAVVSVPLYLVCPTIWSFVVSFAGVLAQAVVQLQVINAI